jgi:hypothetical protein
MRCGTGKGQVAGCGVAPTGLWSQWQGDHESGGWNWIILQLNVGPKPRCGRGAGYGSYIQKNYKGRLAAANS